MNNSKFQKNLRAARAQIDQIDKKLIFYLSKRMAVSKKIGLLKLKHKMAIVQKTRWSHVVRDRLNKSKKLGLDKKVAEDIFNIIQKESIRIQSMQPKMRAK
jgi:chorismate mutase